MTVEHPVRRLLARLCSADTMSRIVDPTLADVRVEDGRLTWRGCVALARALALHAVLSLPGRAVRVYADDGHAIPRLTVVSAVAALVAAVPLVASPLLAVASNHAVVSRGWLALLLIPQAVAISLPAALLVAIPIAVQRVSPSARLVGRVLLLSSLYVGLTFIVIDRLVPPANQSFRTASSGISDMPPGEHEIPSAELKRQIDVAREVNRLRGFQGSETVIRRVEYGYEQRLSLSAAALPIATLALACAFAPFGRRRPLATGLAALAIYVCTLFGFDAYIAESALRASRVPAGSLAWVPNATLILIAGAITALTVRHAAPPREASRA